MLELSREECLRLLASHSFGRLAVNMGEGAPLIRPVNYVFDEPSQSVCSELRTGRSSTGCCIQPTPPSRSTGLTMAAGPVGPWSCMA
jgi:hypothetical protein